MTTGRLRSKTKTLRLATAIVVVICAGLMLWLYAVIIADLNDLGHPLWASGLFGLSIVGLIVWAIRHQLRWSRRAQVAADAHPLSTLADVRPGAAFRLRGRVQLLGDFRAPVTGRQCALFNLDILENANPDVGPMSVGCRLHNLG